MRHLILALALLPTIALAAAPNAAAEREARSFLPPCKPGPDRQLCLIHQRNFIEQYVYAKAGDFPAQRSTAESFDTLHLKTDAVLSDYVGMPRNQLQSCAWWLVDAQQDTSLANPDALIRHACGGLGGVMQSLAMHRADLLLHELRTHPARMPSDDWEPIVAGLKP